MTNEEKLNSIFEETKKEQEILIKTLEKEKFELDLKLAELYLEPKKFLDEKDFKINPKLWVNEIQKTKVSIKHIEEQIEIARNTLEEVFNQSEKLNTKQSYGKTAFYWYKGEKKIKIK